MLYHLKFDLDEDEIRGSRSYQWNIHLPRELLVLFSNINAITLFRESYAPLKTLGSILGKQKQNEEL